MTNQIDTLMRVFYSTNFITYYKTHVFHFNVEGKNFSEDHKLLRKVYEFLQAEIDNIGEQIRQMDKTVPSKLVELVRMSEVEEDPVTSDPEVMYDCAIKDIESLIMIGEQTFKAASNAGYRGLETYIGDYLKDLGKLLWMVKATTRKSIK